MQKFSELIKKSTEDGVGKKKPAVRKGRFKIAKSDDDYRIGGIYRGENESNGNPGGHVACRMVDWLQGA